MKNYLLAIDNELQNQYDIFINKTSIDNIDKTSAELCEDIIALLDYYIEPIFNNGKNISRKKLGLPNVKNEFSDEELNFISNYKTIALNEFSEKLQQAIAECYENRKSDKILYEQIIEVIVRECIKIFRYAQLSEFNNNNIEEIYLITDNDCYVCSLQSKFKQNVKKLMNEIEDIHPFCKVIYEAYLIPENILKQIDTISSKLKIGIPNLITNYDFKIVDNICKEEIFINELNKKYDDDKIKELLPIIDNNIICFKSDSKILISNNHLNDLEYIVIKSLIEDKIMNNDLAWWKNEFYDRQNYKYVGDEVAAYLKPFVNNIAEQNYESFFIESSVEYIRNSNILKQMDIDNYNHLKNDIFNGIEFLKG